MSQSFERITVLGSGSWGTALANHIASLGNSVTLWARREEQARAITEAHENTRYLPGIRLPDSLQATADLEGALRSADCVLSVVPSQVTRSVWESAKQWLKPNVPIVGASKGIENDTYALVSEIMDAVLEGHPTAQIAGPSFAKEVAAGAPTAVVVGSKHEATAKAVQTLLSSDTLRAYVTEDVVGIELGGALKNIIAIACGCSDGLGFGHNTRAALITRGLAEITRMGVKLGADPLTLAGLGGVGDLVLTCTGDLSRNRRVGLGLGQGKKLDRILEEMGQVAEGVKTTLSAYQLAKREGVSVPITDEVYSILYEDKPARESVIDLMRRGLKHEQE